MKKLLIMCVVIVVASILMTFLQYVLGIEYVDENRIKIMVWEGSNMMLGTIYFMIWMLLDIDE